MRTKNFSAECAICLHYLHYPYPTLTATQSSPLPYTYYYPTPTLIPSVTLLKALLTITMNTLSLHAGRNGFFNKLHFNRHAMLSFDDLSLLYPPLLSYSCSYLNSNLAPLHMNPFRSLILYNLLSSSSHHKHAPFYKLLYISS